MLRSWSCQACTPHSLRARRPQRHPCRTHPACWPPSSPAQVLSCFDHGLVELVHRILCALGVLRGTLAERIQHADILLHLHRLRVCGQIKLRHHSMESSVEWNAFYDVQTCWPTAAPTLADAVIKNHIRKSCRYMERGCEKSPPAWP
ncbi:hypothetical protein DUNSADRAFT_12659 [Dunaliella salina]|uniref:Encoded protein n=1 Tax=Dunaliella salina TaxID=3046 RepID=A0ABQ7H3S1_DUNSA|nr:hypothetical protein DUNSADRAFT_12659 [Dunaliella salina]|eukprot:KAF5841494.1 hypothetical protein DUNSADRAFT_12659 [Dunaliella salina]